MLSVYTIEQNESWDAIVHSFKEFDIYYLSGYVKAFQIHGDGDPLLFFYEEDGREQCDSGKAINVVMRRDIAMDIHFKEELPYNKYFDITTPYGYGGWIIEGNVSTEKLTSSYEEWCRNNNIISEFVRYHPVLENHEYMESAYDVIALGNTINIDLSSPETIWSNLTSKNRNMIRKARKNGIRIYNGRNAELYEIFREIYNGTMDKDHAANYYYFGQDFYKSGLEDLPWNAQIFYAELEGKVIAASIILGANRKLNYHLSGSRKTFQHLAPTNLLLYEASLWGCENGYETFHLGGGIGSANDSLYSFKKAFYRKEPCQFYIGKKVFLEDKYNELIGKRKDLPESSYFPRYRA